MSSSHRHGASIRLGIVWPIAALLVLLSGIAIGLRQDARKPPPVHVDYQAEPADGLGVVRDVVTRSSAESGVEPEDETVMLSTGDDTATAGGLVLVNDVSPPFIVSPTQEVAYSFSVFHPGGGPIGNVTLDNGPCGPVVLEAGDENNNSLLEVGETWTYSCSRTYAWDQPQDIIHVASVSGVDLAGNPVSAVDTSKVAVIGLNVEKRADVIEGCVGTEVTYTLISRIQNGVEGIELRDFQVFDDQCAPLIPAGGDANGDDIIQFGEEFTNQCTQVLTQTTTNIAMDSAVAWFVDPETGEELEIGPVAFTSQVVVTIFEPVIDLAIDGGLQTVPAGSDVTFSVSVTNTGSDVISEVTVLHSVANSCDDSTTDLLPGEVFTSACTANAETGYTNIVAVIATAGPGCTTTLLETVEIQTFVPQGSLGDYVWIDSNEDGLQGDPADEPPVQGVTVNLLDGLDQVIATATTDADGWYGFDVDPGAYVVEFVPPAAFQFTQPDANGNGNDGEDSDADPVTGRTDPVTVAANEVNLTLDAGLIANAPAIDIIKLPDLTTTIVGADVTWTITVQNIGNITLDDVTVTDAMAPNCDSGLGTMEPGESRTYTCTLPDIAGGLVNVAEVIGYPVDGQEPVEDDDDAVVEVVDPPTMVATCEAFSPACEIVDVTLCVIGEGSPMLGRTPLDLVLVLDESNSMLIDGRLAAAKAAAKSMVDQLDPSQDRVAVVSYANVAHSDIPLTSDFDAAKAAIDGLTLSGQTCIGCGVEVGQAELDANARPDVLEVIVFLTDGTPNIAADGTDCNLDGPAGSFPTSDTVCTDDALSQAAIAKAAGTVIFTVGLGLDALDDQIPGSRDFAEFILVDMASDEGKFFDAISPDVLDGVFDEITEQLINVAGTDVTIIEVLAEGLVYIEGSAVPAPSGIDGSTLTWDLGLVSIGTTSCVSYAAMDELPGPNRPVGVMPDSRVEYTAFDDTRRSESFPDCRVTVESCTPTPNCVSITSRVFWDENGSGAFEDGADETLGGVTVLLLAAGDGSVVDTQVTAADGTVEFLLNSPGAFRVMVDDGTVGEDFVLSSAFLNPSGVIDFDPLAEDGCPDVPFGYRALCDTCGVVWFDADADGIPDEDLIARGINGATVELVQGGEVVAATLSAPGVCGRLGEGGINGFYAFDDIPEGVYEIVIDLNTVPDDLSEFFDQDPDRAVTPRQSTTAVEFDLSCDPLGVNTPEDPDFGFVQQPTAVTLVSFTVTASDNGAVIEWTTAVEFENLGYNILRSDSKGGDAIQVNEQVIPGQGTSFGTTYRFVDSSAEAGETYYYWLEDIDWHMVPTLNGPAVLGE